jgi:uncharacterized repeat protein (TIGR03803 family)
MTSNLGGTPEGLVLLGKDLYGTANAGGVYNRGTIFRTDISTGESTVMKDFTGGDGAGPHSALALSVNTLYGVTPFGGDTNSNPAGNGVVFKINADGNGFAVLKKMGGDNGMNPFSSLAIAGESIYGTTIKGGRSMKGVVFTLRTDGSGFCVLKHFSGPDGATPNGLIISGDMLYGSTVFGGTSNCGVVFALSAVQARLQAPSGVAVE